MGRQNNNQRNSDAGSIDTTTPTMLDEDLPAAAETVARSNDPEDTTPAKDVDGIPYCRKHHVRLKYASGGKETTATKYYKCPVPGCEEKAQVIKTPNEKVVPSNPVICQHCSKPDKPVYCERDPKSSTASFVILKCPACGWKSNALAVPQLAAAHFARREKPNRPPIEEIGRR